MHILFFIVYTIVYQGHFCVNISLCLYVFCLLVVLVKLSVLAKRLARKTPLMKPKRGEGIVSTKSRPESVYDFLIKYSVSLFCDVFVLSPALRDIFHTPMA